MQGRAHFAMRKPLLNPFSLVASPRLRIPSHPKKGHSFKLYLSSITKRAYTLVHNNIEVIDTKLKEHANRSTV